MSIVTHSVEDTQVKAALMPLPRNKRGEPEAEISDYSPTGAESDAIALVLRHFTMGTTTMNAPRVEFNDLSVSLRDQYDQMQFNTYQPNNGEAWQGDPQSAWRSRALRPIVRNKIISIAAHATARLIFPKVFARNAQAEDQADAARVMEDLMEWSADESGYAYTALMRVIAALSSPASIGYTEYGEVYRKVKVARDDKGQWIERTVRDGAFPCFMDSAVPVDQLYIENIYEPEIQRQGWLIWRKVYSYSIAQSKYSSAANFKYVRPGVQTICDDANRTFYYVYDPNMRSEDVEEVTYWNRSLDLRLVLVNGVLMTEPDACNPRADKLYPFEKFGYEPINSRFFYYKSMAFKLQQDADIVNTLYQMVIDGTYLSIFKPMVNVGGEIIASDVIVPGAVTTLSSPDADLRAISVGSDLKGGLETLATVEKSIEDSAQEPLSQQGDAPSGTTAYEISRLESNANTVLGLFLQMIARHVKDFGRLRVGDIVQYLTMPEVAEIEGDRPLAYKAFMIRGSEKGSGKGRRIWFDPEMPESVPEGEWLDSCYDMLAREKKGDTQLYRVNPALFRELSYSCSVSPDVLSPRSSDLERAYDLETFDRMIQSPSVNQEEALKLLLSTNPSTRRDPEKYVSQQPAQPQGQAMNQAAPSMPAAGNGPLAALSTGPTLPALPR